MPTYEYQCEACSHRFETFQSMLDKPIRKCPNVGNSNSTGSFTVAAGCFSKGAVSIRRIIDPGATRNPPKRISPRFLLVRETVLPVTRSRNRLFLLQNIYNSIHRNKLRRFPFVDTLELWC